MGIRRRLRAMAGTVGPAVFTGAWVTSTIRQHEYSLAEEHLSGLAAPDARNRHLMTAGFLTMGGCTVAFARELEDALGGPARAGLGPTTLALSGWATVAAGLMPRDRMLLRLPGEIEPPIQSWKNDGHDMASAVIYGAVVTAPLMLAQRFRDDPDWDDLVIPSLGTSALSVALLVLFASRLVEPWNGIVQRLMVTVPMVSSIALSRRLLRRVAELEAAERPRLAVPTSGRDTVGSTIDEVEVVDG
jgi:hypothetical protein